jgi:hypothetical protein
MMFSFVLFLSGPGAHEPAAASVILAQPVPDAAIVPVYQELRALDAGERRRALEELPSGTKASLWSHHLLTALAEHPEFTGEQRAVIREALSLVTLELFELEPSDPRWGPGVDQPLRRLKQRARAVFDSRTARELFLQMGPAAPEPVADNAIGGRNFSLETRSRLANRRVASDSVFPDCECSVLSDWCTDWTGLGVRYCSNINSQCWFKNAGCGTLGRYACNGMCYTRST